MFRHSSEHVKKQRRRAEVLYAVVTPAIKESVERLAKAMGISTSEYVRQLILSDLDKRAIFTSQLKEGAQ
jgi:hypothetical protein